MSRGLVKRIAASGAVLVLATAVLVLSPRSLGEAKGAPAPTPTPTQDGTLEAEPTPWPAYWAPTYAPPSDPTSPATGNLDNTSPWTPSVLADVNAVTLVGTLFPSDSVFEPAVAVDPFDTNLVAVSYQRQGSGANCGLDAGVRISRDGGRTWRNAPGRPWNRTGRGPNYHGVVAWGPGPTPGSSRLWWADTTVPGCNYSSHSLSVSYSDNLGLTWSPLYVERRTPPWIGGFPDVTVDNNPNSPNFGVVYVAYNWPADLKNGPGLAVLASADGGASWQMTQVPAVGLAGYPAAWRIGYRIRTAPDGSAYVAFYEADMRRWNSAQPFASLGLGNVGRIGFAVARVHYDRTSSTLAAEPAIWAVTLSHNAYTVVGTPAPGTHGLLSPEPKWEIGLDIDQSTGRVLMAVSDYYTYLAPGRSHGVIKVGYSDDGQVWQWSVISALPRIYGRSQSAIKPTLATRNGVVFVGFHGLTDVAGGLGVATVGTYWAMSYDGGNTFTAPRPISTARWDPSTLAGDPNGTGLRERADFGPDGLVRFAYGDGRLAAVYPGRSAVFVALVDPGIH